MFYPISCTKLLIIFGKNHQNSILNLLPQLQDRTLNTGWTDTNMHTLYYIDNMNPAHYNFIAFCMWNNANYNDKSYTNIHTQCTSNCQRPNHSRFLGACSVIIVWYMFLQNIFITPTSNYIKRILHSHTDHYPNNRAKNWKKLSTEQLNRSIACHRSRDE